ncbi:MAG: DUF4388 domain-containing protein [Chloroflexi bacterium]|nr:DUF4388 domain-containing protein [Chloroflexota bacterium]
MPIQGNLRDFSTTQLLNLINLSGRTGVLRLYEGVSTGERDANNNEKIAPGRERAQILFKSGKLVYAMVAGRTQRPDRCAQTGWEAERNAVQAAARARQRNRRQGAGDAPDRGELRVPKRHRRLRSTVRVGHRLQCDGVEPRAVPVRGERRHRPRRPHHGTNRPSERDRRGRATAQRT